MCLQVIPETVERCAVAVAVVWPRVSRRAHRVGCAEVCGGRQAIGSRVRNNATMRIGVRTAGRATVLRGARGRPALAPAANFIRTSIRTPAHTRPPSNHPASHPAMFRANHNPSRARRPMGHARPYALYASWAVGR